MNRRKLVVARDFFIVLVGIVALISMTIGGLISTVDLITTERDLVIVIGCVASLIFCPVLYFIFRKKEEVGAKKNV